MTLTIPTLITLFRIVLIPVFVVVFYLPFPWANEVAAIIFLLASVSDWVDGYLARAMNLESAFGAFLDPVADKLMVAVAIIILLEANPSLLMVIPSIVIISREITVSALREWMAELGSRATIKVSFIGKAKTTAQLFSLLLMLYHDDILGLPIFDIGIAFYYLAAALTIYSMFIYLRAAWPVMSRHS